MSNNLPTVDIKGKDYVLVKDRVLFFNETFKNGSIETELVSPIESKTVVIKATVIPDVENPTRKFVDYSQAVVGQGMVNMTSALENASTSAVGRALAYMGIGVIESIASADEVQKAIHAGNSIEKPAQVTTVTHEDRSKPLPIIEMEGDCLKCGQSGKFHEKVSGPASSRPNTKYLICASCGSFYRWNKEETK